MSETPVHRNAFGSARVYVPVETYPDRRREILMAAMERARTMLAQELRGITAGPIPPGLFPIAATGVSLEPVAAAAAAFLTALPPDQRETARFPLDSEQWRRWHNMHPNLMRHGVCLLDLDDARRDAALAVVRATLSAAGYANARDVMKLNEHVAEITGRTEEYGEWYYFLSIFGEPSEDGPWGWQLDGHHLIINAFACGDQLVLTPYFSGSEPVVAETGRYAGTRTFDEELDAGLTLMRALSPEQQRRALIGDKVPRDVLTTAQVDNLELPYAGIAVRELDAARRELLLALVGVYVGRMRPGHAAVRMDEVRAHLEDTHFAWIGVWDDEGPFYYRVHSPVILIEFDHLPGLVYDDPHPSRRHVHTIVRTPNGNDYGHDLLRRHYLEHDHGAGTPHRRGTR
jgi:hypothetical protein